MSWIVEYTRQALKDLESIDRYERDKVYREIEKLQISPDLGKQLVGPLKDFAH